jgi:virginiamycin B lyase
MKMKSNKMLMSRRKAIAGILATGAGLSLNFATAPLSFASSRAAAANPSALKLKATLKNSQITLKTSKIAGKKAKAALKNYTLKTNAQPAPFAAATTATFTAFPITTTSSPRLGNIVKGDDGSSFFFVEENANRIGKITTQGAITEYLLPLGNGVRGIANGPDDTFWFTYSGRLEPAYIGKLSSGSGQVTLYNVGSANDDLDLIDITRGPHDPLWFVGTDLVGCIYPDGQDYTIFHIDAIGTPQSIVTGNDGALWFTYDYRGDTFGVARITTAGDLTYYPVAGQTNDIVAGDGNDLWFTQENSQRIGRLTTSGQLTLYQLPNVSSTISAPSPRTIARVASGTYAFGALADQSDYMGTITRSGDITLYQQPNQIDVARDAVYAGWANEVWFTTYSQVCKFRLNS